MVVFDIFISHASEDLSLAKTLKKFLEENFTNSNVFVSSMEIKGGSIPYEEIRNALRSSKAIISLVTPNSINNKWVNFESGFGLDNGITLPLLIDLNIGDIERSPFKMLQCRTTDKEKFLLFIDDLTKLLNYKRLPVITDLDSFISNINKISDSNKLQYKMGEMVSNIFSYKAIEDGRNIEIPLYKIRFKKAMDSLRDKLILDLKRRAEFEELINNYAKNLGNPYEYLTIKHFINYHNKLSVNSYSDSKLLYYVLIRSKLNETSNSIEIAGFKKDLIRFESSLM